MVELQALKGMQPITIVFDANHLLLSVSSPFPFPYVYEVDCRLCHDFGEGSLPFGPSILSNSNASLSASNYRWTEISFLDAYSNIISDASLVAAAVERHSSIFSGTAFLFPIQEDFLRTGSSN